MNRIIRVAIRTGVRIRGYRLTSIIERADSTARILDMKYYLSESLGATEAFKTEIRHVTKNADNRFKGHCQVGLRILEQL